MDEVILLDQQEDKDKFGKFLRQVHRWQEHGVRDKKCFTVDLF